MNERDKQLLFRLISEARMVSTLIAGMDLQGFLADEKTKRAVCMTHQYRRTCKKPFGRISCQSCPYPLAGHKRIAGYNRP